MGIQKPERLRMHTFRLKCLEAACPSPEAGERTGCGNYRQTHNYYGRVARVWRGNRRNNRPQESRRRYLIPIVEACSRYMGATSGANRNASRKSSTR
jgi:hypothetical protein